MMNTHFTIFVLMLLFLASTFTASLAQIDWEKAPGNPVLDPGPSGAWDDGFVGMPTILFDGNTYHMWYAGRNNIQHIGYAASPNGITWTKYDDPNTTGLLFAESDPVLNPGQPGAWDEKQASAPFVLLLDTTYHMWYRGKDYTSSGGPPSIGHATSMNGINWDKDTLNNPVLSPGTAGSWDAGYIGYQSVVFDGSIYHLWYKGWNGIDDHAQFGHATSPHPDSAWTKDPNNPVMSFGSSGSWDYPRVDFPRVIYNGNTYHMWYSGGGQFTWKIGYATSPDGSSWTKYDDSTTTDPLFAESDTVLDKGSTGSWEDTWVGLCSVILDTTNSIYKMWYTGGNGVWDGHIGYASSDIVDGIDDNITMDLPKGFLISQNYPNPFNPSTTIEFTLPRSELTTLKVYNILGKEVMTIVSNNLNQGNHSYQFNAKNLASGVYYYQLIAGEYREVKKMILLK